LHAHALAFDHPRTGKRVRFEARLPYDFDTWLERGDLGARIYDDDAAFGAALERAVLARYALGHAANGPRITTAFRLVHEAGDALPELAVDVYGDHLVAHFYDGWDAPGRRERVLDRLGALGFDGVYVKMRPKQANTLVDTRREDLAPKAPVRGSPAPARLVVYEEGLPCNVRLGDGLSTGIFLDQRANRRRVRAIAGGASVVNLFAYTCAFTVAAAAGGARRTISVDAAPVALERGRENMEEAELLGSASGAAHTFVAEDAFAWLARAARRGEKHDLVILDPPSYSSTKRRRFSAASDYVELAAAAIAILGPGGRLLACLNHRGIAQAKFRRQLVEAVRVAGRQATQVKDLPVPSDHPPAPWGEPTMKSALVTLA
jgi:23S rRNA (cytosine1962-C5)-methyltransferase